MPNPENLKPFTGADDPRRSNGKPKGTIHLATRIQKMLDDPDFVADLVNKDGKKIQFKGNPAEAIIRTAILKAMSGNKQWADWLAQNGYGTKQIHEFQNNPIVEILDKYGLSDEPNTQKQPDEASKEQIIDKVNSPARDKTEQTSDASIAAEKSESQDAK